VSGAGSG